MVGAEESLRVGARAAVLQAVRNGGKPSANNATGIISITLSQNEYSKPGAFISVNRFPAAEA
jgi:hypothetical protein